MHYYIYGIKPKQYENEIAGGDSVWIDVCYSLKTASNMCKVESAKREWHEVEMRAYDENKELVRHQYYKNGKLKIDMSI